MKDLKELLLKKDLFKQTIFRINLSIRSSWKKMGCIGAINEQIENAKGTLSSN